MTASGKPFLQPKVRPISKPMTSNRGSGHVCDLRAASSPLARSIVRCRATASVTAAAAATTR